MIQSDLASTECLHGTEPEHAGSEQLPGEYHDFRGTSSLKKAARTPSTNKSGQQTHCCSASSLTPAAVNLKLLHGFPLKLSRVESGLGDLLSKAKIAGGGGAQSVSAPGGLVAESIFFLSVFCSGSWMVCVM
ncbi:hypothetical protein QQF64_025264 [Cirrhinus molitorella]|uniref:Uncharacterized protein n=1 Tax=Cirrhinus molitorella TaxID=172907 RepID=A0ABR3NNJ8_9TELE